MATETTRKSRVAGDIPAEQKEAIKWIAHTRSTPDHKCSIALIVREAVDHYLRDYDELPPKAREKLGEDFFESDDPLLTPDSETDLEVEA